MPQSSLTPVCFCFLRIYRRSRRAAPRSLKSLALRPHIGIVEAIVGCAEQRKHLEGNIRFQLGVLHRLAEPGPFEGLAAERIAARPGKGVPIGDGKTQMVFHALAQHQFVGIVEAVGERIRRIRTFIFDRLDVAEKTRAHAETPLMAG